MQTRRRPGWAKGGRMLTCAPHIGDRQAGIVLRWLACRADTTRPGSACLAPLRRRRQQQVRAEFQRWQHHCPPARPPAGLQVHMRTGTSSPFTSSFLPFVSSTTTGRLLEKPSAASCLQQSPAVAGAVAAAGVVPPAGAGGGGESCSRCLALPAEAQGASSRQERASRQRGGMAGVVVWTRPAPQGLVG